MIGLAKFGRLIIRVMQEKRDRQICGGGQKIFEVISVY